MVYNPKKLQTFKLKQGGQNTGKHVPNKGDEVRFSYFDQKSVQLSTIPKVVVGTMRFQTPYLEHGSATC